MKSILKQQKRYCRYRRHKRVRAKIYGTAERPRFCVFRSNKHIYSQLINDEKGEVLVAVHDYKIKQKIENKKQKDFQKKISEENKKEIKTGKIAIAYDVGILTAQEALKKKIKEVVFDRGGYKYHGRVKALAEGARKGGLKF